MAAPTPVNRNTPFWAAQRARETEAAAKIETIRQREAAAPTIQQRLAAESKAVADARMARGLPPVIFGGGGGKTPEERTAGMKADYKERVGRLDEKYAKQVAKKGASPELEQRYQERKASEKKKYTERKEREAQHFARRTAGDLISSKKSSDSGKTAAASKSPSDSSNKTQKQSGENSAEYALALAKRRRETSQSGSATA